MLGIKDAIKKIYSGENVIQKHLLLFVLTGIPVMLSMPINEISKKSHIEISTFILAMLAILFFGVISLYLGGYIYGVYKNAFDENREDLLPELNKNWFGIFLKGLPIQLVWGLYYMILMFAGGMILTGVAPVLPKFLLALGVLIIFSFILLSSLGLPFVFAKFSINYEVKGLFGITLPFKYLKKAYKDVFVLILKIIPLFIAFVIVSVLGGGKNVFAYIFSALSGYLLVMLQYIMCFCYVQIYKKHAE